MSRDQFRISSSGDNGLPAEEPSNAAQLEELYGTPEKPALHAGTAPGTIPLGITGIVGAILATGASDMRVILPLGIISAASIAAAVYRNRNYDPSPPSP